MLKTAYLVGVVNKLASMGYIKLSEDGMPPEGVQGLVDQAEDLNVPVGTNNVEEIKNVVDAVLEAASETPAGQEAVQQAVEPLKIGMTGDLDPNTLANSPTPEVDDLHDLGTETDWLDDTGELGMEEEAAMQDIVRG